MRTIVTANTARGRIARSLPAVALVFALAGAPGAPVLAAPDLVPVSVTITRVTQFGTDIDPGITQGPVGDFYAGVTINGVTLDNFDQRLDFGFECCTGFIFPFVLEPAWRALGRTVDDSSGVATVAIEIWDNDDCDDPFCTDPGPLQNADDQVDASPTGSETVALAVNLATGEWTGDINFPQRCARGTGGEAVEVCFEISTLSTTGDLDGDGLLDAWETDGVDFDYDGTVDVDLPGFGADPSHKDLFLELDWMTGNAPTQRSIDAVKAAFAAAPINAGTNASAFPGGLDAQSNPDGQPGINLWVDTGGLTDPNGTEDGGATSSCSDGIDNAGDGATDAADADCLAGDNLGGGNAVTPSAISDLNSAFYTVKRANFNAARGWTFRYGLSAAPGFEDGSAAGNSCFDGVDNGGGDEDSDGTVEIDGNDSDCWPWGGGWGEIGGNDFIEYNLGGGIVMHEFGHNLNLRHGGFEGSNCKPNYVSVMNYDNQSGINQAGGATILDYSPPRFVGGRGNAPLPNLDEDDLNENIVLDATDPTNMFVFKNSAGRAVQWPLNAAVDWDGDGTPPGTGTPNTDVTLNLDTVDNNGTATTSDDSPAGCRNGTTNSVLRGSDDWTRISLPFRQFGDAADGAINKVSDEEPTTPELDRLHEAINTTDLALAIGDAPDPVAAGAELTYTLMVTNSGPNPANDVRVLQTLPAGTSFASGSPGCSAVAAQVTCVTDPIPAGTNRVIEVSVDVAADLVYTNGGPKTISTSATVQNLAGPDSDTADNSDTESTQVVAVADVKITSVSPGAPLEVLIGQPASVPVEIAIENGGPSSPIDTTLSGTAAASAGASVTPATTTSAQAALAAGPARIVTQTFTLSCATPGVKTVSFDYDLALVNAADTDPDPTNNERSSSFQVDCVVPIAINIRPGGLPNSINLNTDATLAALTTRAGEYGLPLAFDARSIQAATVRFGLRTLLLNVASPTGGTEIHGQVHLQDSHELDERTRDRDLDGVMHFKPPASGLTVGTTEACLKGRFTSGLDTFTFFGCDSVVIRGS
jgi:uncharacterized repeat protein (TIGR01451 family)